MSPLPLSISSLVAMNQYGIRMLQEKDYGEAVSSFSNAITGLKQLLADYRALDLCSCPELVFSFELTIPVAAEEIADHERPFVFENPIRIASQPVSQAEELGRQQSGQEQGQGQGPGQETHHQTLKTLSFVLVFNLALAFHLGAIHHKSATTLLSKIKKRFLKALAFYKLALSMFEKGKVALGIMESMAIANNQAHIYTMLSEPKEAELCYQQVLSNIMYAADKGYGHEILQFERFLSNVVAMPSPTARAA